LTFCYQHKSARPVDDGLANGVPCSSVDADTRSLVRRSVSNARRRLAGAELGENGMTDMQAAPKNTALPLVAWEACDGDGLLALAYALDFLDTKGRARTEAA
jgi:hypothetical protein